jgi:hypothetical protein
MDTTEIWAEHFVTQGTKAFFHGKRGHNPGLGHCCREVSEKQVQRSIGFRALQGSNTITHIWGCYSDRPCAVCLREAGKGLWTTTNEPPRPLEELFPDSQEPGEVQ